MGATFPHFGGHQISDQGVSESVLCVVLRRSWLEQESRLGTWSGCPRLKGKVHVHLLNFYCSRRLFFLLVLSRWTIWYEAITICWHISLDCSLWQWYYWTYFSWLLFLITWGSPWLNYAFAFAWSSCRRTNKEKEKKCKWIFADPWKSASHFFIYNTINLLYFIHPP